MYAESASVWVGQPPSGFDFLANELFELRGQVDVECHGGSVRSAFKVLRLARIVNNWQQSLWPVEDVKGPTQAELGWGTLGVLGRATRQPARPKVRVGQPASMPAE